MTSISSFSPSTTSSIFAYHNIGTTFAFLKIHDLCFMPCSFFHLLIGVDSMLLEMRAIHELIYQRLVLVLVLVLGLAILFVKLLLILTDHDQHEKKLPIYWLLLKRGKIN